MSIQVCISVEFAYADRVLTRLYLEPLRLVLPGVYNISGLSGSDSPRYSGVLAEFA